jgi:hypothetical protein
MIRGDQATATLQMRETGVMGGGRELPIRCPAIAHEQAGKIRAEHCRRFLEAAARLNAG